MLGLLVDYGDITARIETEVDENIGLLRLSGDLNHTFCQGTHRSCDLQRDN
jgi:hypothetical protein